MIKYGIKLPAGKNLKIDSHLATAINSSLTFPQKVSHLLSSCMCSKFFCYHSGAITKTTQFIVNIKWKLTKASLTLLSQLIIIGSSHAMLTANSNHFITGNAPYITFSYDDSEAKNMDDLIWIKQNDTKYDTQSTDNYSNPIVLSSITKAKQITTAFSDGKSVADIVRENHYWIDKDGDILQKVNGGQVTITVKNQDTGRVIDMNDIFNPCHVYQFKLAISDTSITTSHGIPQTSRIYPGSSRNFYVQSTQPAVCSVLPGDLKRGGEVTNDHWSKSNGFKVIDINNPSVNFPTLGARGLFFYLNVPRGIIKDITYIKEPANSGIDIAMRDYSPKLKEIKLIGPGFGADPAYAATAVATTFKFYAKNQLIYSFKINRWYIAAKDKTRTFVESKDFCQSLSTHNSIYRMLTSAEFDLKMTNPNQRLINNNFYNEWGNSGTYSKSSDFTHLKAMPEDELIMYWTLLSLRSDESEMKRWSLCAKWL
jgi:hypothetical protein